MFVQVTQWRRTVAKNAMQLIFRKESQPADTFLLIFPQLGLDGDRNVVLLHLTTVKELGKELPLLVPASKQVLGKVRQIRKTSLQRGQDRVSPSDESQLTSSGTILTNDANVLVAVDRISSFGSLMRPRTGTMRKIT